MVATKAAALVPEESLYNIEDAVAELRKLHRAGPWFRGHSLSCNAHHVVELAKSLFVGVRPGFYRQPLTQKSAFVPGALLSVTSGESFVLSFGEQVEIVPIGDFIGNPCMVGLVKGYAWENNPPTENLRHSFVWHLQKEPRPAKLRRQNGGGDIVWLFDMEVAGRLSAIFVPLAGPLAKRLVAQVHESDGFSHGEYRKHEELSLSDALSFVGA